MIPTIPGIKYEIERALSRLESAVHNKEQGLGVLTPEELNTSIASACLGLKGWVSALVDACEKVAAKEKADA